jgi:predicted DCC family thiol-disulfide oxidoreductase YuxK
VPSSKPVLLYDGNCGFCRIWIDYWRALTRDRIEYAPSQEAGSRYPQIQPEGFEKSVQLVRPDGSVAAGAQAVLEALGPDSMGMHRLYESSAPFRAMTEAGYHFVAGHRNLFYHLTRFTFGTRIQPARFAATQWVFVRLLAIVYAIAFVSMGVQVLGLIGSHGILPVHQFLGNLARQAGPIRYLAVPSIFWWGDDDATLVGVCAVGVLFSVILFIAGFRGPGFQPPVLVILFVLYLSLSAVGEDFLSFQWDSLLLETGFLAIFLARTNIVPWLFRWLAFRLYFLSGLVKLLSDDPTWRNLTALHFHYYTQPLPTVLAWYVDKMPMGFQRISTLVVLVVELAVPFLIFAPRRLRKFGAACMVSLQVLIVLTGNYTFFNLLAILLCLFLLDDRELSRFVPPRFRERLDSSPRPSQFGRFAAIAVAVIVVTLGLTLLLQTFTGDSPEPFRSFARDAAPLNIVNSYGLFAVMTTSRPEIVVEGSMDGQTWAPYSFRYKPGDLRQAPRWVAPYQPRLDWQMWFAALGSYRSNPWFINFVTRLLDGSPQVLGLLAGNPFPEHPPRYIRAMTYDYTFTTLAERRQTGAWWKREPLGTYLPPVGLRSGTP